MKIKVVGISILFSVLMVSCNGASEEIIINTPTIQCGMCQKIIEVGLAKVDGISNPRVDLKTKKTVLLYNPEKTNVKLKMINNPAKQKRLMLNVLEDTKCLWCCCN